MWIQSMQSSRIGRLLVPQATYPYFYESHPYSLRIMHHLSLHLPPAPPDAVWLLACSGGQDSVVLAHLAHRQGLPFALAHVNYRLRGPESDMDEIFVRELAAQFGVAFHVSHPVIDKQAGVQEQARHARYAFFGELLQAHGYAGILTAHHAQDQAETLLLNLLRGTGLKGLRGMLAYSPERKLARPLLHVAKADIEAFAQAQNLLWREDGSNAGDTYTRNRLRHHLLPVLHQLQPGWEANLLSTASQATEAWQSLTASPTTASLDAAAYPSQFSIFNFQFENRFARAGRIQAAYPGLPFTLALRLADAVDSPTHPDRKLETALGTFELREETLYFTPAASPAEGSRKTPAPPPAGITLTPGVTAPATLEEIRAQAARGIYYLNQAACPAPYTLRPPREGDRIKPLGMAGTKLLSDLRQEAGLPPLAARDLRVLEAGGEIVWVSLGVVAEGVRCAPNSAALRIEIA